ncbi:YfkD famly protein [Barrientosiimonas marina]|uniref:YfkD family protein n=1 Tax=Lentibacillus kimchii TaxID=1542911 RepID=A0ABW2UQE2_9BACI
MTKKVYTVFFLIMFVLMLPISTLAAENEDDSEDAAEVPDHVFDISQENTYPNATEEQEVVEPSDLTQALMEDLDIPIENPELIKMLNETSIDPSPISFGYRGMVYIGRWPLHYESEETNTNWEYQSINTNELNNIGGDSDKEMQYEQQEKQEVKGALTTKIANSEDVKKMILLQAKDKMDLPLAYTTVVGQNTKKANAYNVPVKKHAKLKTYAPAVNERGQVTFGEVYFQLKGNKKKLVVQNVTKQGIGAWLPVQDHVSFSFQLK